MLSVGIGGLRSNEYGYGSIAQRAKQKYVFPDDSILYDYPGISTEIDDATRATGDTIVRTLAEFNVDVELVNIVKGPTVTMYEIRLHEGTLVSKVTSKYNELSLNLGGVHIRILAPVPGKQVVGIEVPNKKRDVVGFKDMLREYKKNPDRAKLNVPMILGRTITGSPQIIDVAKMPHMLIAGTTGSGKSVCINTFICTVLYTRSPKEVRFIMIDPKVVELSIYNGIPHLLTPVITEPKKVVKALKWLCDEMDRRYNMLSRFGVRNIKGLNEKIQNERIPAEKLPYIVLIMDEFADIMTISEMTPGPITINSATFVGIRVAGIPGAIVATLGCIIPSAIIVLLLAYVYYHWRGLDTVQSIFRSLRPCVIAMIASAEIPLISLALYGGEDFAGTLRIPSLIIFTAAFLALRLFRIGPIATMVISGTFGLIAGICLG